MLLDFAYYHAPELAVGFELSLNWLQASRALWNTLELRTAFALFEQPTHPEQYRALS
jgi:hypothetical protein